MAGSGAASAARQARKAAVLSRIPPILTRAAPSGVDTMRSRPALRQTIFLLSPAYCAGRRAAILLRPGSTVPIARQLQAGELTLGEAFSFLSGLYFRGKLTYAFAFGRRAGAADATLVLPPPRAPP